MRRDEVKMLPGLRERAFSACPKRPVPVIIGTGMKNGRGPERGYGYAEMGS